MRKAILVDLDKLHDMRGLLAVTEPKDGDDVEVEYGLKPIAIGKVANVRPCPAWPERWAYDVTL